MDELAKRFADLAEKYGPNVVDAALQAARIEAYSRMVSNLCGIVVGIGIVYGGLWAWRKKTDDDTDILLNVLGGFGILIGIGIVAVAITNLADPWLWTTLQHPELWIAKKVFKL